MAIARLRVPPVSSGFRLLWFCALRVDSPWSTVVAIARWQMFPWTLAIPSTSEMFAERFDSAIYLWPSFSVISSAAETFAERLGQALCFGPLTGRTGRTSPLARVSSPLVLAVFSVLPYVCYAVS